MNEAERRVLDIIRFNYPIGNFADPNREIACIDTYTYSVDYFNNVGVSDINLATSPKSFDTVMDSDSDFVLTYMSGGGLANFGVAQTKVTYNPAMTMQVTDRSTGRTFFNVPTMMPLVTGGNGFPFILSSPRLIKPRTTLRTSVAVIDNTTSGQQFFGFFLCFHGAKIYYK